MSRGQRRRRASRAVCSEATFPLCTWEFLEIHIPKFANPGEKKIIKKINERGKRPLPTQGMLSVPPPRSVGCCRDGGAVTGTFKGSFQSILLDTAACPKATPGSCLTRGPSIRNLPPALCLLLLSSGAHAARALWGWVRGSVLSCSPQGPRSAQLSFS